MLFTAEELLPYRVGALLYTPAVQDNIAEKICDNAIPSLDSVALCLEDAITEQGVRRAEEQLCKTLSRLSTHKKATARNDLPLIFVRVRGWGQATRMARSSQEEELTATLPLRLGSQRQMARIL